MTKDASFCDQHDLVMSQLFEIGAAIREVQSTLVRLVIAAVGASSAIVSAVVVLV